MGSTNNVLYKCDKENEIKYSFVTNNGFDYSGAMPMVSKDNTISLFYSSWTVSKKLSSRQIIALIIGLMVGLYTGNSVRKCNTPFEIIGGSRTQYPHNSDTNLVFIGVMTAELFLDSRVVAVYETWAQEIPGKVGFFTSETSVTNSDMPVIRLKGVDDSYPPQKKSFMMLKYMYDNFLDHYEYFMRVDDDLYVQPRKLETFLRSLNSSKLQFIGKMGKGNKAEIGNLSLLANENYCMGGPGVIFSRATLSRIVPYVQDCIRNMHSYHEDVEIGRCVQKYAGIGCTWSLEMGQIMVHESSDRTLNHVIKYPKIDQAMTIHPIKDPLLMYKIHHYQQEMIVMCLETEVLQLMREIGEVQHKNNDRLRLPWLDNPKEGLYLSHLAREPNLQGSAGPDGGVKHETAVLPFSFITTLLYSLDMENPMQKVPSNVAQIINEVIKQSNNIINKDSKTLGREIKSRRMQYGYERTLPGVAVQFVLDIILHYRRYNKIGRLPVRRHGYIQIPFGALHVRELSQHMRPMLQHWDDAKLNEVPDGSNRTTTIHFLLPLSGQQGTFIRFMENYERVVLKSSEAVTLTICLFHTINNKTDDGNNNINRTENKNNDRNNLLLWAMKFLKLKYPTAVIDVIRFDGNFQRAAALQLASSRLSSNALLLCLDVEMSFTEALLHSVRLHTLRGKQVYFPIVFSKFEATRELNAGHTEVTEESGYFCTVGFGIMSVYNSDLVKMGGFKTSFTGWGGTHIDLYNKFVSDPDLNIFRSPEPALVHVYYKPACVISSKQTPGAVEGSEVAASRKNGNFKTVHIQGNVCPDSASNRQYSLRTLGNMIMERTDILS